MEQTVNIGCTEIDKTECNTKERNHSSFDAVPNILKSPAYPLGIWYNLYNFSQSEPK